MFGSVWPASRLGSGWKDGQVLAVLLLHPFSDFRVSREGFDRSRLERCDSIPLAIQAGQRPVILLCRNSPHDFDAITVFEVYENHSAIVGAPPSRSRYQTSWAAWLAHEAPADHFQVRPLTNRSENTFVVKLSGQPLTASSDYAGMPYSARMTAPHSHASASRRCLSRIVMTPRRDVMIRRA
jgi:hypothetical protein